MRYFVLFISVFFICNFANAQKVYKVKYESQADIKVYIVDYESQADLKIYIVNYSSQAGWRTNSKRHLLDF